MGDKVGETPHDLFYRSILIDLYGKSSFLMNNKGLCDQFFMTSEYEKWQNPLGNSWYSVCTHDEELNSSNKPLYGISPLSKY